MNSRDGNNTPETSTYVDNFQTNSLTFQFPNKTMYPEFCIDLQFPILIHFISCTFIGGIEASILTHGTALGTADIIFIAEYDKTAWI